MDGSMDGWMDRCMYEWMDDTLTHVGREGHVTAERD